jgi:two-component system cell cycle sensor histidine kinase/response regulator CckA
LKGKIAKEDGDMGSRNELMDNREGKKVSYSVDEALRESEASYRRLFETAQDGILIIDADTGRITDANPFVVDMLGYVHEDFIGKALWSFGPFKDIRASRSAFDDLMSNGYIRYEHLPLETRDGRRVEVEFISNIYQVGQKRTIQCNIRDNSQRKRAEETRLRLESQLRHAQKMDAIATLAGGIAHQFNNALTVITAGLELLEEDVLNQKKDEYIQLMKKAADQMTRLTRQLLAHARGGKYYPETMSLCDLVSNTLPMLKTVLKPSITLKTELPSGLPQIRADRDQMQMALLAVLANALEAIETQGLIRIICRKEVMTDEKVKAFAGLVPGTYVSLTVRDNGKGMDEETRNRVFEPFFTTHFFGRGLGLAAVYGIVKNHDGWISIESHVDQGTAVCIYLPAVDSMEKTTLLSQSPNILGLSRTTSGRSVGRKKRAVSTRTPAGSQA